MPLFYRPPSCPLSRPVVALHLLFTSQPPFFLHIFALFSLLLSVSSTLYSTFLSPAIPVSPGDRKNLIARLLRHSFFLAISVPGCLRGEVLTDERKRPVYGARAELDLILLNTGAHTHFCLRSEASSALDLAFCSPRMAVHVERSVLPD